MKSAAPGGSRENVAGGLNPATRSKRREASACEARTEETTMNSDIQTCARCEHPKPGDAFGVDPRSGKRRGTCAECMRAIKRADYWKDKAPYAKRAREQKVRDAVAGRVRKYPKRRKPASSKRRILTRHEVADRLLRNGVMSSTGCLLHCDGADDYLRVRVQGELDGAHRVVLERKLGRRLAADEVARHTCDVPGCILPEHLIPGTDLNNIADMIERGRHAHGETSGTAVLDDWRARSLLAAHVHLGLRPVDLGPMFGVDRRTANDIVNRATWKHIEPPTARTTAQ